MGDEQSDGGGGGGNGQEGKGGEGKEKTWIKGGKDRRLKSGQGVSHAGVASFYFFEFLLSGIALYQIEGIF